VKNARVLLVASLLAASCATTAANPFDGVSSPSAEPPLPNSTPQTAVALPVGLEVTGSIGCGQVAWYQLIVPSPRVITMRAYGQALEHALGATATVTFIDPAMGNLELGNMVLPVFARAPNWDPREQQFMPPHPGTYYARVTVDPNGCQRVALRMTLQ
jgi:hypothetical protein